MDILSIFISLISFSLFIFLSLLFTSNISESNQTKSKLLLIASFLMFASITSLYLELYSMVHDGSFTVLLTLITYSMLLSSICLIANLISRQVTGVSSIRTDIIVVYSLILGILFSVDTLYGNYLIRSYLMLLALFLPLFQIGKALFYAKRPMYKSPYFYQIILLILLYLLKMVNLDINPSTTYLHPNIVDTVCTLFSITILITFQVTYKLEEMQTTNYKLRADSSSLETILQQTKKKSMIDPLTGLYNRTTLEESINSYYQQLEEPKQELAVAMIDIRHFKKVNDFYGHRMGDKVLKHIANQLTESIRTDDILGRWGGDEFLIIYPNTKKENFDSIRETLLQNVNFEDLVIPNDFISLSVGLASAKESNSAEELLHLADLRMYLQRNITIKE